MVGFKEPRHVGGHHGDARFVHAAAGYALMLAFQRQPPRQKD
jgi:hypothetical protein